MVARTDLVSTYLEVRDAELAARLLRLGHRASAIACRHRGESQVPTEVGSVSGGLLVASGGVQVVARRVGCAIDADGDVDATCCGGLERCRCARRVHDGGRCCASARCGADSRGRQRVLDVETDTQRMMAG